MHEEELRRVLLVKAVEEADREGTLIPPADRAAAARDAARAGGDAQRLGAERARILLPRIVARHPFVDTLFNLAGGPAWLGWILLALGFLAGFALSALDGTRRINVLAFPLFGVVLWNLVVYVVIAAEWIRARSAPAARRRRVPELLAQLGMGRVSRLASRSGAFNAALGAALARFAREWLEVARPLLVARAIRVLHFAAAALGIGLIAGLYLRGIAFDYQAGWESTFLDAPRVRALLSLVYGTASSLTGIPIPDVAQLEAIRWKNGAGGERAAPWIHLLAATVAIFVVIPRTVLALVASVSIGRWSRALPQPPALTAYFRGTFGAQGGALGDGLVTVVPYAYEPSSATRAGLRALLPPALGGGVTLDMRAPVRYGDEDEFLRGLDDGGKPDTVVLLFNLAATPEEENHGALIAGLRDWLGAKGRQAQLLVLVDEGPYAARMANDGGAATRVAERRGAWKEFVATHALVPCSLDLAAAQGGEAPSRAVIDCVRNALWQPTPA